MAKFWQEVREELIGTEPARCPYCAKAELTAIIQMAGSIHLGGGQHVALSIHTETAGVARRAVKFLKASYHLEPEIRMEQWGKLGKPHRYTLMLQPRLELDEMLDDLGMFTREHCLVGGINSSVVRDECCRAAFLRGAFLSGGSITDPRKKTYHLELVTGSEEMAEGLVYLMSLLQLKGKISRRKEGFQVYLKESDAIVRFLTLIKANSAVLKLEETRVIKSLRGEVNRRVNCETANLEKTLSAAWEQVALIQSLIRQGGYVDLPLNFRQTAELRLLYPEATLQELAELHQPPVSKSTVNHRFRFMRQYGEKFQSGQEDFYYGKRM